MDYQINKDKFLSEKEFLTLKQNLSAEMVKDPYKFLPVLIGMKTGARRSEIVTLKVANLDFDSESVLIRATKNSDDREIPLENDVFTLLRAYIRKNKLKKDDLLFWSIAKKSGERVPLSVAKIFRLWAKVRPVEKPFHSLRHTFAINIYRTHRDLRLVQVALGHRNIKNTMVYSQYVYQTEELRKLLLPA